MSAADLYHFTCGHGHDAVGTRGVVLPMVAFAPDRAAMLPAWFAVMAYISWWTDQPDAEGSVITEPTLTGCERWRYRYRALDPGQAVRWGEWAHRTRVEPRVRWVLENAPGALPGTWWVSEVPMSARLDPS